MDVEQQKRDIYIRAPIPQCKILPTSLLDMNRSKMQPDVALIYAYIEGWAILMTLSLPDYCVYSAAMQIVVEEG